MRYIYVRGLLSAQAATQDVSLVLSWMSSFVWPYAVRWDMFVVFNGESRRDWKWDEPEPAAITPKTKEVFPPSGYAG